MAKVFISYSRKDIDFAKRLTGELQKSELDFWVDWEGIPPTVDWWREVEKGIEEADVFIFLISPDSAVSKVCGQEIDYAVKNGKRLIPLVVRDVQGDEVPHQLGHLNWIFFRESDDFESSIKKLLAGIHTDYEWVQSHRRLQVKALEWERNNRENSFLLRGKDLQDAELQLATNTSKEPHPTDLQREYVFKSRKATDGQRRVITGISVVGVIALAALAVFGFYQAGQARIAQSKAEQQAQLALTRQLAAQAQSIVANRNSKQMVAVLLATQSMKISPLSEAAQILLNNNFEAHPIISMTHNGAVASVAFSPDGRYVATGSSDGTARVWDSDTGKEIARMTYDVSVSSIAFGPDGKYVVSSGCDEIDADYGCINGTARVWEASTGREVSRMTHDGSVPSAAFNPDGKYVVSGSWDGTARVWETSTGKEIAHMTHDDAVVIVAFSPDGKYVVSGSWDGTARVWEASTGREIARMTHDDVVEAAAFSSDGNYVVTGSLDATVRVWETSTGREIARMIHGGTVISVAFSPDGKYMVSGSYDNTARVWEMKTGKEIARMTHDAVAISVTFSPDGKHVVSSSNDGTARVWEADTGKEIVRMTHDHWVISVAFSPDGKYVISGSFDSTARIWDVYTGKELARMTHDDSVYSVAFSPDGKYVFSGSNGGTARVWEWQPEDLIVNACKNLPRNLTRAEWTQYIGDILPYQAVCPNLPIEAEIILTPTAVP